jgi:hypothetical protein
MASRQMAGSGEPHGRGAQSNDPNSAIPHKPPSQPYIGAAAPRTVKHRFAAIVYEKQRHRLRPRHALETIAAIALQNKVVVYDILVLEAAARVAIGNSRLLACDNGRVRFRWKDYRAPTTGAR